jgi:hypothetical protein
MEYSLNFDLRNVIRILPVIVPLMTRIPPFTGFDHVFILLSLEISTSRNEDISDPVPSLDSIPWPILDMRYIPPDSISCRSPPSVTVPAMCEHLTITKRPKVYDPPQEVVPRHENHPATYSPVDVQVKVAGLEWDQWPKHSLEYWERQVKDQELREFLA